MRGKVTDLMRSPKMIGRSLGVKNYYACEQDFRADPPIGLCMAGGAPQGAIYEIGVLQALDEALKGIRINDFGIFVGVSSGGFLSACLANGITPAELCHNISKPYSEEQPFKPETFFQPAFSEFRKRLWLLPRLCLGGLADYLLGREKRLLDALTVLSKALPVGVFNNEPVRKYVEQLFTTKNRTDDFRELKRRLVVVATELESAETACFGTRDWSHIPISKAVQATTALPGLYPPVEIEGRHYVDGILLKTMHTSSALSAGAKLVFAINPVVPVNTLPAIEKKEFYPDAITRQGFITVISQSLRTLIHSRMVLGLNSYKQRFPDADIILLEPSKTEYENFFSNVFSFSTRLAVCERAYSKTREFLWNHRDSISSILQKHGYDLNVEILADPHRNLWTHLDDKQKEEKSLMAKA